MKTSLNKTSLIAPLLFMNPAISAETNETTTVGEQHSDVIVYGQKLERSIDETISGVSVLDEDQFGTLPNPDINSVMKRISNANNTDFGNGNFISIRGIMPKSTSGGGHADTLSIVQDGTLANATNTDKNIGLWDIESVTVNKGPQSTAQGPNSIAGSIYIESKKPTFDEEGAMRVGAGTDGFKVGSFMLNQPVNDKIAVRVSGEHSYTDGQVKNVYLDDDKHNYRENSSLRLSGLYNHSDDLSINYTHGRTKNDYGLSMICDPVNNTSAEYPCIEGEYQANQDLKPINKVDNQYHNIKATHDISPNISVTSSTSLSDLNRYALEDFTRTHPKSSKVYTAAGEPILAKDTTFSVNENKNSISQELKFTYTNKKITSATGVYISKTKTTPKQTGGFPIDTADALKALDPNLRSTNPNVRQNPTFKLAKGTTFIPIKNATKGSYKESQNIALFNETDIKITEQDTLTLGLRYDRETFKGFFDSNTFVDYDLSKVDKYLCQNNRLTLYAGNTLGYVNCSTAIFGRGGGINLDPGVSDVFAAVFNTPRTSLNEIISSNLKNFFNSQSKTVEKTFQAVLPKIGIRREFNDNITAGYQISTGYRSGGAIVNLVDGKVYEYDPEYVTNHELSLRTNWLDNKISLNANAFYLDWKNQQTSVEIGRIPGFDNYTANAASSELKGIELEVSHYADNGLYQFFNTGYSKSQFKNFISNGRNFSGNSFPFTPKISATYGIGHNIGYGFNVEVSSAYTGKMYNFVDNKRQSNAFNIIDAKIGYQADNWSIHTSVNNVLNTQKEIFKFFGGPHTYTYTPKRSIATVMKVEF